MLSVEMSLMKLTTSQGCGEDLISLCKCFKQYCCVLTIVVTGFKNIITFTDEIFIYFHQFDVDNSSGQAKGSHAVIK